MLNNKRGLSTVVTTLIIILLVLVAIGVVWVVVQNMLTNSGEQIDISQKCVTTNLAITNVGTCTASAGCSVQIERRGGYALNGLFVVVSSATASGNAFDVPGDITVSKTITVPAVNTPATPTNVKVSAYFTNVDSSQNVTCPQVIEYVI